MIRHKAVYRGGRRSTGLYRRDEEEVLGCQA